MKKHLLTLFGLCVFAQLHAQKFELNVDAYSGLYHFSGSGTAANSFINEGNPDYTNNPYGSKNGFSYGGGLRLQYIYKGGFIIGLQADYELLRSKVNLNGYQYFYIYADNYYGSASATYSPTPAHGETYLQSQDLSISPYIGYRINANKVKIDLMPGVDIGFNMSAYNKGNATDDNDVKHATDDKLSDLPTDFRLQFVAAANYGRFALITSYAYGVINLYKNNTYSYYNTSGYTAHSQFIRVGLSYKLF